MNNYRTLWQAPPSPPGSPPVGAGRGVGIPGLAPAPVPPTPPSPSGDGSSWLASLFSPAAPANGNYSQYTPAGPMTAELSGGAPLASMAPVRSSAAMSGAYSGGAVSPTNSTAASTWSGRMVMSPSSSRGGPAGGFVPLVSDQSGTADESGRPVTPHSSGKEGMPPSWAQAAKYLSGALIVGALVAFAIGSQGGGSRPANLDRNSWSEGESNLGRPKFTPLRPLTDKAGMWCFALMVPFGYEPQLLEGQFALGVGMFACDEYTVFSNDTFTLRARTPARAAAPPKAASPRVAGSRTLSSTELVTLPIGGSLEVQMGGKWKTAMNTDIFVRVWTAVFLLGTFRDYAWTVKADPDTVFMPGRLRQMLLREPAGAIYINNCKFGLHGPIEVLSREAVNAYANSPLECLGVRNDAMDTSHPKNDEEHAFGEDQYLRVCLAKLGVHHVNEYDLLLTEVACGRYGETILCDVGYAAFHPFKEFQDYYKCWKNATTHERVWDRALAAAPAPSLAKELFTEDHSDKRIWNTDEG